MNQIVAPERIHLPRFQAAMRLYKNQPSDATYWRYLVGLMPPVIKFIVERPELAAALAADAHDLAKQNDLSQ